MKKLNVKVGEYTNAEGETKGEWLNVGVILSNDNGEFALLDPAVNLAGALMKQRILNRGKQTSGKGDMVMVSIFEDKPQAQQPAQGDDFSELDDVDF